MAKLQLLDLFSGIGGFSLGLERAGLAETVAFCEFDKEAQNTLRARYPGIPIYDDVRTLTADRLRADGIRPDAIVGGFPCQDVSLAGGGVGLAGARSGLWSQFSRLVGELRPKLVGVENVSALLGRGIGTVLGDLAALGYDAEWHCIPASYAGARQIRDRVWIVAYPQCDSVQGRKTVTAAWCEQSRAQQLAGLVQPCTWPTVSGARDRGTGHGVPRGVHRNKQLGNAVVPQVVELLGNAIKEARAA
ncbi:DNA (cytosine-5-)-methyltransferase [Sphingomonas sp. LH128]|uniref:DNA cytosine methyltransferase n=1 Tax=Sphingomonas sp. LH128 TaxID=473781 RepID=UPI00027CB137|nr:DNA (cytosine-5-)-methyltransferase [Sphingomonas sp. LH128]